MNQTDPVKQKIQELVPEVMELKHGCEVLVDNEVMIATHWNTSKEIASNFWVTTRPREHRNVVVIGNIYENPELLTK